MNLLQETIECIVASGHAVDDIVFIGSEKSGHACTWTEFKALADIEYDNEYGAQKVAMDLIIAFSDGAKMWRGDHDGPEYWEYSTPLKMPDVTKKITSLLVTESHVGWCDLADINTESEG